MVRRLDSTLLLLIPTLALALNGCGDDGGDSADDETDTDGDDETETDDGDDETDTDGGDDETDTDDADGSDTDNPTGTGDDTDTDTGDATDTDDGTTTDTGDGTDTDTDTDTDDGTDTDTDTGTDTDTDGGVDGLIGALCEWEFGCCSDGEVDYRLGPFTTDAADCTARFLAALASNDQNNPYPRNDLLATLGFGIDLERSEPRPQGITACIEAIEARECNQPAGDPVHCTEGDAAIDPCRLDQLFQGLLAVGDTCNSALGYDVECQAGSTCEFVTSVNGDRCVAKGLVDDFCADTNECDEGLYCDLGTGLCAEKGDLGDPCAFEDEENPAPGTETTPCKEQFSCNPTSGECTDYCTDGYTCVSDYQCPDGSSCAPAEAGASYGYCRAPGASSGDLCDTHEDCVDERHCSADHCEVDIARGMPCTADFECAIDNWCDTGITGNCSAYTAVDQPCLVDAQCNPNTAPAGCLGPVAAKTCEATLLGDTEQCETDAECASGLCENTGGGMTVCHDGAVLDAACDTNTADTTRVRCGAGLYCDDAADGLCREQVGPGESCEMDDNLQCLNNDCAQQWNADMCSDTAVSADTATCDGEA